MDLLEAEEGAERSPFEAMRPQRGLSCPSAPTATYGWGTPCGQGQGFMEPAEVGRLLLPGCAGIIFSSLQTAQGKLPP